MSIVSRREFLSCLSVYSSTFKWLFAVLVDSASVWMVYIRSFFTVLCNMKAKCKFRSIFSIPHWELSWILVWERHKNHSLNGLENQIMHFPPKSFLIQGRTGAQAAFRFTTNASVGCSGNQTVFRNRIKSFFSLNQDGVCKTHLWKIVPDTGTSPKGGLIKFYDCISRLLIWFSL